MNGTFTVEISIDNDAFQDGNVGAELARILRQLAFSVENHEEFSGEELSGLCRDYNGNLVGRFYTQE